MKKLTLHNDNNKLHCRSFIHICLYDGPHPWPHDVGYEIWSHNGKSKVFLGEAKIIDRRRSTVGKLNESIAAITTGHSLQTLQATLAAQSQDGFPINENTYIHVITFRFLKYGKDHPLCPQNTAGNRQYGRQLAAGF